MNTSTPLPPLRRIAYAQCAEDVVLHRAFEGERPGTYIDVGAGHPIIGSVTNVLHQRLHWRGIEVEPLSTMADLLRKKRPGNVVVEAAVALERGKCTINIIPENWGMSTIIPKVARHHEKQGWCMCSETVTALPLEEILTAHVPGGHIDLLKIDVEGAEAQVLQSFDIERWRPRVMVIEATKPGSPVANHDEWAALIPRSLYREVLFDGLNRFYVRSGEDALMEKLRVGANIFDQFIHLRWWMLLPDAIRRQYPDLYAECPVPESYEPSRRLYV